MNEHPTAAEFELFLRKGLPPDRRRAVLEHLARGCTVCRPAAEIAFGLSPITPATYGEDLDKVFQKVRQSLVREERKAREAVMHIEKGETGTPRRRFCGRALYQELLSRSWSLRHENPGKMVELARHATLVARNFKPEDYGSEVIADLQCRAWAELGNAYRVAEDFGEAKQAFQRAEVLFEQGTRNDLLYARLLDLRASLYGDLREFDLAFGALDTVRAIYDKLGDQHLAGRALITKGVFAGYKTDYVDAIRYTQQGLILLDIDRDPGLAFQATHNLGWWLCQAGRFAEARKELSRIRWKLSNAGGRLNLLKLQWLEAQINTELNELARAETGYLEVKRGFLESEKYYHAAVASLDLAALWLLQGRVAEAKASSLEALEIFRTVPLHAEGLGAMLLLLRSFQMGQATANLVKSVAEYLRTAQNNPTARFEPPSE